jgi:Fe-S-cluster containining protein
MINTKSAIATEATSARSELRRDRTAQSGIRVVLQGYRAGDELLRQDTSRASGRHLPVCKEGCSWCCQGAKVDVLVPEALAIIEHQRARLSPEELERFRENIASAAAYFREMTIESRRESRYPCPLLDEASGRCTIYEVRPMLCRAYNSLDEGQCERACKEPLYGHDIPIDASRQGIFVSISFELQSAIHDAGMDSRWFDLINALHLALAEPDAGDRWAKGDRVFDAAVLHSSSQDGRSGAP